MAPQAHPASDPPKRTPSFVCEVRGRVTPAQERTLLARLEAARQVYNACPRQACRRVRLVRESTAFQHARTLSRDDPDRQARFRRGLAGGACSDYPPLSPPPSRPPPPGGERIWTPQPPRRSQVGPLA